MPHFEDFYADKLRGGLGFGDADAVLDLRDATREAAAAAIQDMLERSRFGRRQDASRSASRRPRKAGAKRCSSRSERRLLEAKKRGWIDRLQTLAGPGRPGIFRGALADSRRRGLIRRRLGRRRRRPKEAADESREQQNAAPGDHEPEGRREQRLPG